MIDWDSTVTKGVAILTTIVIVAILAVLLKKGSLTTSFLTGFGNAFSTLVGRAVSPAGGSVLTSLSVGLPLSVGGTSGSLTSPIILN